MIYDVQQIAALGEVRDLTFSGQVSLAGPGLWAAVVSRGSCSGQSGGAAASAGAIVLGRGGLALTAGADCHLLAAQLCGSAPLAFAAALPAEFYPVHGESCPAAAELLEELRLLSQDRSAADRTKSQMVFALLCELADADAAQAPLPPLVAEAVQHIRHNYAGLYGVEELSEYLGVSKSHLVREFFKHTGTTPGKYLTSVRIDAVKQLLTQTSLPLNTIALQTGFNSIQYFDCVFTIYITFDPVSHSVPYIFIFRNRFLSYLIFNFLSIIFAPI